MEREETRVQRQTLSRSLIIHENKSEHARSIIAKKKRSEEKPISFLHSTEHFCR